MSLKLLMCSNEALGLGHLRRTLRIASALHAEIPNLSTLVLTGSPMVHGFRLPPGVDSVKLPSLSMESLWLFNPKHLPLSLKEVIRLRERITLETVAAYQPHLFLVDSRPVGVQGELLLALRAFKESRTGAALVLGLRDIVGPDNAREQWRAHGAVPVLEELYDEIWVYGCQALYDPIKEYEFPDAVARRVRFCGYLGVEPPAAPPDATRRELGIGGNTFVLVTVGNGRDGFPVLDAYLHALEFVPEDRRLFSLLIGGPDLPQEHQEVIRQRCEEMARIQPKRPVRFIEFSPQLLEYMAAADLVVSMAGYNTLVEILTLEKRALVIPRDHIAMEQLIRASLFERLGLIRMLHPDHLSPQSLAEALLAALHAPAPSRQGMKAVGLDLNGLHEVKTHVLRRLSERGLASHTSPNGLTP